MSALNDVMSNYQHVIEGFELVTGSKGIFDFEVDGQVLYSKSEVGRHANEGEILDVFTEFVGPDVPRYGEE